MASDHSPNSSCDNGTKKTFKVMTLHDKMTILNRIDQGDKYSFLAKKFNCTESSIRAIKKYEDKIKMSSRLANSTSVKSGFVFRRDTTIEKMEQVLSDWIKDQNNNNVPVSSSMIRCKARNIYTELKSQDAATSAVESSFSASKGWFSRFKKRANLHNKNVSNDFDTVECVRTQNYWMVVQHENKCESQNINIEAQIEKIMKLSNIISKEGFCDAEQEEVFDHDIYQEETLDHNHIYQEFNGAVDEVLYANKHIFEEREIDQEKPSITSTNISEILKAAEFLKERIMQEDPNFKRSTIVMRDIDSIMTLYTNMVESKQQHLKNTDSINSIPS